MNLQEMRQRQPIKRRLEAKAEADKTLVYLYGDVVDEKPVDWWTGEEIDKEYILAEDVRNTVNAIESDVVELHINSYGGSLFASVAIFNFLRAPALLATAIAKTCVKRQICWRSWTTRYSLKPMRTSATAAEMSLWKKSATRHGSLQLKRMTWASAMSS